MRMKKPQTRQPRTIVSIVRQHFERLIDETQSRDLLPAEQRQREFDDFELALCQVLFEVERAEVQQVPLSAAIHMHDKFPHLGRTHGALMDLWAMEVPTELRPVVRAAIKAPAPSWVEEVQDAICVVAASQSATRAERALARLFLFEALVLNLVVGARRSEGHFEGAGGSRRAIEHSAEQTLRELLAAPPGLGAGEVRPFEVTVVAALERLERHAKSLWKLEVREASHAGQAFGDIERLFEMRREMELVLRRADPVDAAVVRHALKPQSTPVAHLPKQHPLVLGGMTPAALDQRRSRALLRCSPRLTHPCS